MLCEPHALGRHLDPHRSDHRVRTVFAKKRAVFHRRGGDRFGRRVRAGESDSEIRAYFVSRYGRDILLQPEGTGVAAIVWVLPVAALVCGIAGLALYFRRRR